MSDCRQLRRQGSLARNKQGAWVLEPVLTAAGIDHDIKMYADAGHGFLNDHDLDDLSSLDRVIAKLTATRYHAPSARDARPRIVAFFRRHLIDAPAKA